VERGTLPPKDQRPATPKPPPAPPKDQRPARPKAAPPPPADQRPARTGPEPAVSRDEAEEATRGAEPHPEPVRAVPDPRRRLPE
jgi:hypothetical protein